MSDINEKTKTGLFISENQLDEKQKDIYDRKIDSRFIVQGCAGSGKSCLALLRLKKIQDIEKHRENCYYIATTISFIRTIQQEVQNHGMDKNLIITNKAFNRGTKIGNYDSNREIINKDVKYLLVDECQDFSLEQLKNFFRNGECNVCYFGDDAQKIFEGENNPISSLKELKETLEIDLEILRYNYRLPIEVARFADTLMSHYDTNYNQIELCCRSQIHQKPFIIQLRTNGEKVEYIIERLKKEIFKDIKIGILCSKNENVREIYQRITNSDEDLKQNTTSLLRNDDQTAYDEILDPNKKIQIMTFNRAKGLQFDIVFIFNDFNFEKNKKDFLKSLNSFYVGITRTEQKLYILCDTFPAFLDIIPKEQYLTSDKIEDIEL